MAAVPAVVAQEPAPAPAPEGVMISTRAFINGKEVSPAKAREMLRASIVRSLAGEAPASEAPCCPNPDCSCNPCACTPGAVCAEAPEPTPSPEPAPAPAPEATPAPAPEAAPGSVPAVRVVPACRAPRPVPTCTKCGKPVAPRRAGARKGGQPVDMPPCGKPRAFGEPEPGAMPPCVRRHGQVMRPSVRIFRVEPPAAPSAPAPVAESPKAVRVIINGVEAIVPITPEGVNITIKPL